MSAERVGVDPSVFGAGGCPGSSLYDPASDWIAFSERDNKVWRICSTCGRWTPLVGEVRAEHLTSSFAAAREVRPGPACSVTRAPGGGVLIWIDDEWADRVAHPLEAAEEPIWRRRRTELGWTAAKSVMVAAALLWQRELWDPLPNLFAWLVVLVAILGVERIRLSAGLRVGGRLLRGARAIKEAVLVPMIDPCGEITVGVRTGGDTPVTLSDAEAEEALLRILARINRLGLGLDLGQKERKTARAAVRAAGGPRGFLAALVAEGERSLRELSRPEQFALEVSLRHVVRERRLRSRIRFVSGLRAMPPSADAGGE